MGPNPGEVGSIYIMDPKVLETELVMGESVCYYWIGSKNKLELVH